MRQKKSVKREINPDAVYQSQMVTKFVNSLMRDGKKSVAEAVLYKAFNLIAQKEKNPLEVFERALQAVEPRQEVKARRVGGASYQIPSEVRGERKLSLAIRWIIIAAQGRSNKEYHAFPEKLAAEFLDAIENKGEAVKKKDAMQRMADANRAFSHFRW